MTLSFNQLSRLSILAVLLTALFSATTTFAQTLPCGNIIGPKNLISDGPMFERVTIPVVDCDDPFSVTTNPASSYSLVIEGESVADGGTIALPEGRTRNIVVNGNSNLSGTDYLLFRHRGDDYVYQSLYAPEPTDSELETFANRFFSTTQEAQFYFNIIDDYLEGNAGQFFYDEDGEYIIDPNTDQTVESRFFSFYDAASTYYEVENKPYVEAGTYTMVMREFQLILTQRTIFDRIFDLFIKTAHAQYIYPENIYTITFTITEEVVEPTGASSVLFIPGIMGSRLFEESAECSPYQTNVPYEQERWFAFGDCAQLRMSTNFLGQSLNDLYTKTGRQGIVDDVRIVSNIYENFLDSLQEWEDEEIINEYAVLPYDWRLGLDAIIRSELNSSTGHVVGGETTTVQEGYLYDLVTELAEGSANGRVTIVAHSNGGLVAKHFLDALDKADDPLLGKIENLILVAVPQVGTPEAVIGITHGLELGPAGLVVSQTTARQLSNKMNFAHHLLPTLRYFDRVDTPVISFEEGSVTNAWRSAWGGTVSTRDELHSFLDDDSMRTKPLPADLSTPEVVDGALLNYAKVVDAVQTGFEVPETLKVYQVAGTGLETPSGLTYFTDRYCVNRILFSCTEYADKLGYRVNMVIDGDESVVVPSALAQADDDQVEKLWFNLFDYNDDFSNKKKHKDIFEIQEINDFIKNVILNASTTDYTYLATSAPILDPSKSRLVFQLHSPLDMFLTTADGREISSSTETIKGATYRRYGELQYISVSTSEEDLKLLLKGTAPGSFTLDIEKSENGEVERQTYSAIPSTSSTIVEVQIESSTNIQDVVLAVDYEGDGVVDVSYDTQGIIEEVVTYEDLYQGIENLNIKRVFEKVLLNTAQTAEKFYEKSIIQPKYKSAEGVSLVVLEKQLTIYKKLKMISTAQLQQLQSIIKELINK